MLGKHGDVRFLYTLLDEDLDRSGKRLQAELSDLERARKDYEELSLFYSEYLKDEETVERALTKTFDQIEEMLRLIGTNTGEDSRGS